MGKLLIFSENNSVIEHFSKVFEGKFFTYSVCQNESDLQNEIENGVSDIYIFDENSNCDLKQIIQRIKNISENSQIILFASSQNADSEIMASINGYILDNFSDGMILNIVNTALKTKSKLDKLTISNKDMKESLYRLNVLYNTSSQFAGTLDTKELLGYMAEGLEKSLSFDLACTISFGFENEPVLIIDSVYDVPFNVLKSGVLEILNDFTGDEIEPDMHKWKKFSELRATKHDKTVHVGLVAKYVGNEDTYICVTEALKAAAAHHKLNVSIDWVNAEELGNGSEAEMAKLKSCDGIVVPGGFGVRGTEGKITAATYALENDVPYLGLCLGMQVACIAAARKGGVKEAGSEEFGASEKDGNNVIYIMEGQAGKESTGGTMRLGDYPAVLKKDSTTAAIYRKEFEDQCYIDGTEIRENGEIKVVERHRHRYEVNQKFLPEIEKGGLKVSGTSPDGRLVEFVEAPGLKFFQATQAHPEFKSRPLAVHPLFYHFMKSLR